MSNAIARGMMAGPRLPIFDEPSLGLSPLLLENDEVVLSGTGKDLLVNPHIRKACLGH